MTTIAFVRHGETDWNLQRRLQGRADIPMNETGFAQARAVADSFSSDDWSLVLSSPLGRAVHTAKAISEGSGIPMAPPEVGLIERSFGEAEGATAADVAAKWADRLYPGAEAVEDVRSRGAATVDELVERHGGNLILVSHGAFIRATVFALVGEDIGGIANGATVMLRPSGSGWSLLPDPVATAR